jgi:hypothetical protein
MKRAAAQVVKQRPNPFSVLESDSESETETRVGGEVAVSTLNVPTVVDEVEETRSRWAAALSTPALNEKKGAVFFKRNTHAFPEKVGDIFSLAAFQRESPSWKPSPAMSATEGVSEATEIPTVDVGLSAGEAEAPKAPKTMAMRIKESLDAVERARQETARSSRNDTWPPVSAEERLTSIRRSLEKMSFFRRPTAVTATEQQSHQ